MECSVGSYMIQMYIEGTIDPLEKIFVEEHLKVCKKCRKELTRLKLLYFELENLDEPSEVPDELEQVRNMVLDNVFDTGSRYGMKKFIYQQKKSMSLASGFVNYIPGSNAVKKGIKATGSMIGKVSLKGAKRGLKYGLKLIQERT